MAFRPRLYSRRILPYIFAIAVSAGAGYLQLRLNATLDGQLPLVLFPTAVAAVVWVAGVGPGLLTTVVTALIAQYLFFRPLQGAPVAAAIAVADLALFMLPGLVICFALRVLRRKWMTERRRRASAEYALKQTEELESLARGLSKAQTSPDVAMVCLTGTLPAIGADNGALALVNDDSGRLEVLQAVGFEDVHEAERYRVPLSSKTVFTEVLRRRGPVSFGSQAGRRQTLGALPVDPVLQGEAAVVVPLLRCGKAIGVIAFGFEHARAVDDDDTAFLTSVVQRTVQALDRAAQYERAERGRIDLEAYRTKADNELQERQRVEEALRESETRYRALAARTNRLYTLSSGLSESISLDAVAKVIVRHGRMVSGASAASVALLSDTGERFETLYSEDYPRQLVDAWRRFLAEPGLCSTTAVKTRRPVVIGSFSEWQQHYPRSASLAADGGFASAAVLPLLVEGAAIGVLSFHFTAPLNFDEEYMALLASVAQHAAQAIDRARLYEAEQRARSDAETANRSKDEFLSIVSHELRTPLTAVLGWAGMLRGRMLDTAKASRAIEAIYTNATRQVRLIDELLDVSRIIAGRAPLDLQEMDVARNIRGAVDAMLPLAEEKGLEVQVAACPDELRLVADPHRLEQVFANLLGNAIKFTPAGGRISVSVACEDGSVDVRIADTGRGIDRAFLPYVFERFRQADSTATRVAGGLGLGLFITRSLVEAHGGRITVESDGEGRGATFTVSLPASQRAALPARTSPDADRQAGQDATSRCPSLQGVSVLLVDDEEDSREAIGSILESCGAIVTPAASGDEAIEMMSRAGSRVDLLLSDIAMPGTDGYELIRRVRAQAEPRVAATPAAAITACTGPNERERALAAGFQDHLVKPITPEALAQAVASLTGTALPSLG